MKLTSYKGKVSRVAAGGSSLGARTTVPGYVNPSGQQVVESTGMRSTTRDGQVIYRMRCRACGLQYGANGIDVKARTCPGCQGGSKGEPLVEKPAGLFS